MQAYRELMMAELYEAPFDNKDWVFEVKYDGYRAATQCDGKGNAEMYSRNLKPLGTIYDPVENEMKKVKRRCLLDGEIVVEDEKGISKFQLIQNLQRRGGVLKYYVFDILELDGKDVTTKPLLERKKLLKQVLKEQKLTNVHYSDHIVGDGLKVFEEAKRLNLEGMMAKNGNSLYRPGRRSDDWLKIKINFEEEAIIVGYTQPKGARQHFGSLLLGMYVDGKLKYIGNCGTGFNNVSLKDLFDKMQKLKSTKPVLDEKVPFKDVTWVIPELVCQVKYTEWTADEIMRHPVFLGLRFDKPAKDVIKRKAISMNRNKTQDAGSKTSTKSAKGSSAKKTTAKKTTAKKAASKTVSSGPEDQELKVGPHMVKLTSQDKMYWAEDNITKGDFVNYYASMADLMLPYLKDRPQSMHRFPNGADKPGFFQKDVEPKNMPEYVRTEQMFSESTGKMVDYIICDNKATLVYMANLGCIEIHPWNSRVANPEKPDWLVIDLDPEDIDFQEVVKTALAAKKVYDEIGLPCYVKTSGSTGIHICVPLGAKYEFETVRNFAEMVARRINAMLPDTTSVERSPSKRKKKVYLDYLQNSIGQTLAAPYSVRPKPGATVSTPLEWKEVNAKLSPKNFTIKNILKRVKTKGDLWKPVLGKGVDMNKALKKLEAMSVA
ncbi:MAG TPA: DNA ligase D [Chitinophagales bacterium]|nr:DNA ligase D [Chitinophagales bacterium]